MISLFLSFLPSPPTLVYLAKYNRNPLAHPQTTLMEQIFLISHFQTYGRKRELQEYMILKKQKPMYS